MGFLWEMMKMFRMDCGGGCTGLSVATTIELYTKVDELYSVGITSSRS